MIQNPVPENPWQLPWWFLYLNTMGTNLKSFSSQTFVHAWEHYNLNTCYFSKHYVNYRPVNKCNFFLKPRNINVLKTYFLHPDECFNTALSPYAAVIHMIWIRNCVFPLNLPSVLRESTQEITWQWWHVALYPCQRQVAVT